VLEWNGYTYWIFSYTDNREALAIVAFDADGAVRGTWERPGARYVYRASVNPLSETVTFAGQSDWRITMRWDELRLPTPASMLHSGGATGEESSMPLVLPILLTLVLCALGRGTAFGWFCGMALCALSGGHCEPARTIARAGRALCVATTRCADAVSRSLVAIWHGRADAAGWHPEFVLPACAVGLLLSGAVAGIIARQVRSRR
jgi:hypothetical protein